MWDISKNSDYEECSDLEKVEEIRTFISCLEGTDTYVISDHIINLLPQLEGFVNKDKKKMLDYIDGFLNLSDQQTVSYTHLSLKRDSAAVRKAENDFSAKYGRSPKITELAEATGFSAERVLEALQAFDAMKPFEAYEKTDLWPDDDESNITKMDLAAALQTLEPKMCIRDRFWCAPALKE